MNELMSILRSAQCQSIPSPWKESYLPPTTPHLYIWMCDGSKLGSEELPIPSKGLFNYCRTLEVECAKLARTNAPVILVYMESLLSRGQKDRLAQFADGIPNLLIVSYERFDELAVFGEPDEVSMQFSQRVEESKTSFLSTKGRGVKPEDFMQEPDQLGTIAHLVDFSRMALLYDLSALLRVALQLNGDKAALLPHANPGIVYRDFDVTIRGREMTPIRLLNDKACSTTLRQLINKVVQLRQVRQISSDLDAAQRSYLREMTRPEIYADAYEAVALNKDIERLQAYQSKHEEIMGPEASFAEDLIWYRKTGEGIGMGVGIENSMLAFSRNKDPDLAKHFLDLSRRDPSVLPYTIIQQVFYPRFSDVEQERYKAQFNDDLTRRVLASVRSVHSVFNVSNDLT